MNSISKYLEIYNIFRDKILTGIFKPEQKLPTELEICKQFNVSRTTAMKVLNKLQNDNLIERNVGKGSYVLGKKKEGGVPFHLLIPHFRSKTYQVMAEAFSKYFFGENEMGHIIYTEYNQQYTIKIMDAIKRSSKGAVVLLYGEDDSMGNIFEFMKKNTFHCILGNHYFEGFDGYQVSADEQSASEIAFEHLEQVGRSKIAYVGPNTGSNSRIWRFLGYKISCQKRNINIDNLPLVTQAELFTSHKVLELIKNKNVDSFIAQNEYEALRLYEILRAANYKVPDDISIVSLDGNYVAPMTEVPFTSVDFPAEEMGKIMADTLYKLYYNRQSEIKKKVQFLRPTLKIRASSELNLNYRHNYLNETMSMFQSSR
jgi:GntR family transcriptional regulator, arabinose operon transcriptional repressor